MQGQRSYFYSAVVGGSLAGLIDIGAACLINLVGPVFILQVVASGALGHTSFSRGYISALLGLALQLAMSIIIATIYFLASWQVSLLRRYWLAGGVGFGVCVFAVMNYVVVPLSALARFPHFTLASFIENMFAMLLFGTIIAWFAREGG
jgi:hypothetical protein